MSFERTDFHMGSILSRIQWINSIDYFNFDEWIEVPKPKEWPIKTLTTWEKWSKGTHPSLMPLKQFGQVHPHTWKTIASSEWIPQCTQKQCNHSKQIETSHTSHINSASIILAKSPKAQYDSIQVKFPLLVNWENIWAPAKGYFPSNEETLPTSEGSLPLMSHKHSIHPPHPS